MTVGRTVHQTRHGGQSRVLLKSQRNRLQMQLTSKDGNMVVDFYPVKFNDGSVSESRMIKIVTFMNSTQSKSLINKKDFQREVDSRVEGYGYEVTGFNEIPQFQGALGMAC